MIYFSAPFIYLDGEKRVKTNITYEKLTMYKNICC